MPVDALQFFTIARDQIIFLLLCGDEVLAPAAGGEQTPAPTLPAKEGVTEPRSPADLVTATTFSSVSLLFLLVRLVGR